MPHIFIEYTKNIQANVNFHELFSEIADLIEAIGIVRANVKCRAQELDTYYMGDEKQAEAFVALHMLCFFENREPLLKALGPKLKNTLEKYFIGSPNKKNNKIVCTVNITPLSKDFYFK